MSIVQGVEYRPIVGDPDDHRPDSSWALMFDPPREDGPYVRDVTCIVERMAPGDAIPLHTHETVEVVVIQRGGGTYQLGGEEIAIDEGGVAFVPAGTPHGLRNDREAVLSITAFFPSDTIEVTYLARNPAPGTEGDPPQPPMRFDPRVDPI
jgi:hypothetical protein